MIFAALELGFEVRFLGWMGMIEEVGVMILL